MRSPSVMESVHITQIVDHTPERYRHLLGAHGPIKTRRGKGPTIEYHRQADDSWLVEDTNVVELELMEEWWCPSGQRNVWCPGPCPDGREHEVAR